MALTPVPPTVKMVLSVPLVNPFTGPSNVTVSVMVSPALLPGVPAMAVPMTVAGMVVACRVGAMPSTMCVAWSATALWVTLAAVLPPAMLMVPPFKLMALAATLIPLAAF